MDAFLPRDFTLRERDFRKIARLVKERAGISLSDSKRDLVYSRLSRRLRALGIVNFSDYCRLLEGEEGEAESRMMVNAITTNLTGFFREPHHFEALGKEVLPGIVAAKPTSDRRLRIWSAGCSSGEEPYSIAITLCDAIKDLARWDAKILATDIDSDMIATGMAGKYELERAETIPARLRHDFLLSVDDRTVEMSAGLRSLLVFKQLNLLDPWPMRRAFDIIFCRNVVIYFDKPTQRALFDRFADMLAPEGWLFIGHSETLSTVSDRYRLVGRTIYRRSS